MNKLMLLIAVCNFPMFVWAEDWLMANNTSIPEVELKTVVNDDRSAKNPSSGDYKFTLAVGSGWHGLNIANIEKDGTVNFYQIPKGDKSFHVQFNGGKQLVDRITKILIENDFINGPKVMSAGVADGTQWILYLEKDGVSKYLYLDNYFPEFAISIASVINLAIDGSEGDRGSIREAISSDDWSAINKVVWNVLPHPKSD